MGWLEAIIQFFKLGFLIIGEIFAAKKRAREADEAYELDKTKFRDVALKALEKMRAQAREDSGLANKVEDEVDKELEGK